MVRQAGIRMTIGKTVVEIATDLAAAIVGAAKANSANAEDTPEGLATLKPNLMGIGGLRTYVGGGIPSLRQLLLELRRDPMPISQYPLGITIFTVHWSKDGGSYETRRINSVVAVAKARQLEASGYRVRITDRRDRQFAPCEFGELLY
jgi:hypothetical protein